MNVFVFESNESGRHNTGSALIAKEKYGAIEGQAFGLQGNAYGIPTIDKRSVALSVSKMLPYVKSFIQYAIDHPDDRFKAASIGCGIAKYPKEWTAPLFVGYPSNVDFFEEDFKELIGIPKHSTRLMIVSSKDFADTKKLWDITTKLTYLYDLKDIEIVPAMESVGGRLMSGYAKKNNIAMKTFKPQWTNIDIPSASKKVVNGNEINASAMFDKTAWSLAYSTDLLVFDDFKSKELNGIMTLAQHAHLRSIWYLSSTLDTNTHKPVGDYKRPTQ